MGASQTVRDCSNVRNTKPWEKRRGAAMTSQAATAYTGSKLKRRHEEPAASRTHVEQPTVHARCVTAEALVDWRRGGRGGGKAA